MGKFQDLTGKRYGRLVVIRKVGSNKNKKIVWECLCDCGNTKEIDGGSLKAGLTKSCGCWCKERSKKNRTDLTGRQFQDLTVIKYSHSRKSKINPRIVRPYWICECRCGKTSIKASGELVAGKTTNCGKCHLLVQERPDLIEEWDFEKNKDININEVATGSCKKRWWKCKECGKSWQSTINNRSYKNSGCPACRPYSRGEKLFKEVLIENKVGFDQEKTYPDCKYRNFLRFDFYLKDFNILIELQGRQHYAYHKDDFSGNQTEEEFNISRLRDQIKRDYCEKNNIKLIEIHYKNFYKGYFTKILREEKIING